MEPKIIQSKSLQEEVYLRLRQMIWNRDLQEQKITIRDLAEKFGVSTMPVREALRRLESEGLVHFARNKRVEIVEPSRSELMLIWEIRERLEPLAATRAIPHLGQAEFARLEELVDQMDVLKTDPDAWREANTSFHRTIYAASRSNRLVAIIESLWAAIEPYLRVYVSSIDSFAHAQEQHRAILSACRAGDGELVERLLVGHLVDAKNVILSVLP